MDELRCRLCFQNDSDLINVYSEENQSLNIQHILMLHFWFEITKDDPSTYICSECWVIVRDFHKFYNKILEIQNSNTFNVVKTENELNNEKIIIKSENKLIDVNVQVTEDIEDNNIMVEITANDFDEVFTPDTKLSVKDDIYCTLENDRKTEYIAKVIKTTTNKKKKSQLSIDREQILKEDSQIKDFFDMTCNICTVSFKKFQEVKSHYREKHQMIGYLSCCSKKFYKRYLALEHVLRHIDPESFRCHICSKMCANKPGLQSHIDSHQPDLPFKCEKCQKSFARRTQYNQHQKSHAPKGEKLFSCTVCEKSFVTKSVLQLHIRSIHEGKNTYICEICAKVFKSKMFYESHLLNFHSNIERPKLQCIKCNDWLKNEHSLRNHMRKHEEPDKLHICTICGSKAPNKSALQSHVRYMHSTKSHICTICEKTFKVAVRLKEHMTTHTGEVLYTCQYCPKTFNSSANMHSHRKKNHRKEWEANRKTDMPSGRLSSAV